MRLVATFVVVLASSAGCYRVDADISGLSASAGDQMFPAAGADVGNTLTVQRTLTFPSQSTLVAYLVAARIDQVVLAPASGTPSLDFLRSLTLVVRGDDQTPDVTLIDASTTAGSLRAPAADGTVALAAALDLDPRRLAAPLTVDAALSFVAPAEAWGLSFAAALTVHGGVDVKP